MSIVEELCRAAAAVKYDVQKLSTDIKNKALYTAADKLVERQEGILAANREDIAAGRAAGMNEGLIDRLTLTESRIEQIAEGLRQVAQLPDPVGELMDEFTRPNGMKIRKVRVPMGQRHEDPQSPRSHGRYRRDLRIKTQCYRGRVRTLFQSRQRRDLKGRKRCHPFQYRDHGCTSRLS